MWGYCDLTLNASRMVLWNWSESLRLQAPTSPHHTVALSLRNSAQFRARSLYRTATKILGSWGEQTAWVWVRRQAPRGAAEGLSRSLPENPGPCDLLGWHQPIILAEAISISHPAVV
jgi:hypothetical protein